ncbi:MAG: hypothetical protein AAF802_07515 [Planctomycetota bacterium]
MSGGSEGLFVEMNQSSKPDPGRFALVAGIGAAFLSALVTSAMLLINGTLTLVALRPFAADEDHKGMLQFALFVVPVVLSVGQWIALDIAMGILRRSKPESEAE